MGKTARMVMKIIGASLALAAAICLLIGGWHDLRVGVEGIKNRLGMTITQTRNCTTDQSNEKEGRLFAGPLFLDKNKKRLDSALKTW